MKAIVKTPAFILAIVATFGSVSAAPSVNLDETYVVSFVGPNSYSGSEISYSMYAVVNTNKIVFAYEKESVGEVVVRIYDEKGTLLHKEVEKGETYGKKRFDLTAFQPGTYQLRISSGNFVKDHRIEIGVTKDVHFTPYISSVFEGNKVKVAFQNAVGPVDLKVVNRTGNSYYTKTIKENSFNSLINLSQLPKGKYTVQLLSGTGISEKEIFVD